ncbi:Predicted exporter [Oryzisolibacter propanilivorax]|uniref:Predicted exporter n=1 Tax=Oryzisolibacter propanilivorax TaxID=1527607 RepID=A0A1G9QH61_9BURK|nr:MMPL family transporter [Oryzisolibacter propanilivorax]SDM09635.1 Predicted exporter [Oryzisolibacter propanilivorax]
MRLTPARILLLWLLALLAGAAVIARGRFVADMSFFLPSNPSAEQRMLVAQMSEGSVSRLLMLGIEGGDAARRAQASRALRQALADGGQFVSVQNGELDALQAERDFLLRWRYHLSPAVTPARFTEAGLRAAVEGAIDVVTSPVGALFKPYLLQDPTGELLQVLEQMHAGGQPPLQGGVWAAPDGSRALLLVQTRAAGSDTDGQERAIEAVRAAFAPLAGEGADALRLVLSGPGQFAVQSREQVRSEISRTSALGMLGITLVLAWVYRSARTLALSLLPVVTGAVAGVVVVGLVHGSVHGITVGFGAALIGEAVDYAIYFCIQSGRHGLQAWRQQFWPTIRLGVLTSVAGFGALLLAGFPGLAQLGLYALSGVATAALVTRFVLPALVGTRGVQVPPPGPLSRASQRALGHARVLRWPLLALALLAAGYLAAQRGQLWSTNLSALSMVSAEDGLADARLRADLGAPDARYLVLVHGADQQQALERAEDAGARLQVLVEEGVLGGFDSPARFLPSQRTQRARLAALPARNVLEERLQRALSDAPLSPQRLAPFVDAVEAARTAPLLTRADLEGTALALAVDALLSPGEEGWNVVLPLHPAGAADEAEVPVATLARALQGSGAVVVDLKGEFERMYDSYLRQAVWLSLAGVAAIALLLAASLRSVPRLARVLLTLAVTVLLVLAGLHLAGVRPHLLHLVGLLLVVAVGSNYALFFDRVRADGALAADTWLSMSVAVLTTAIGFGVLALSRVPVLQALGVAVAPGVLLAMLVSAALILPAREAAA